MSLEFQRMCFGDAWERVWTLTRLDMLVQVQRPVRVSICPITNEPTRVRGMTLD